MKWCTRDAVADVFEKMSKYCQAGKSWWVQGIQAERLAMGKTPRCETTDCVMKPIVALF